MASWSQEKCCWIGQCQYDNLVCVRSFNINMHWTEVSHPRRLVIFKALIYEKGWYFNWIIILETRIHVRRWFFDWIIFNLTPRLHPAECNEHVFMFHEKVENGITITGQLNQKIQLFELPALWADNSYVVASRPSSSSARLCPMISQKPRDNCSSNLVWTLYMLYGPMARFPFRGLFVESFVCERRPFWALECNFLKTVRYLFF